MAKPLKIILIVLLAFVGLLVIAGIALAVFFDPNAFRGKISGAVKESTGRELTIAGDIDLTFFPWLGVNVSQVTLGNAPGFGPEPFAQIGEADISVRLMPLITDQEVQAGTVTLQGLKLNLAKNAEGRSNWEDLGGDSKTGTTTPDTPTGQETAFEIGGLEIKNATLTYTDAQSKKSYKIDKLNFKTGMLKPGKAVDVDLEMLLTSADPALTADLDLNGTLDADTEAKRYRFADLKLDVAAQGQGVPAGQQNLSLTGNLDLDQAQGTMKFSDAKLALAGLTLSTTIDGKGMNTESPTYTGPLTIAPFNPRTVLGNMKIQLPEPSDASALKEASLNANLVATSKSATLNDLRIKLDQTHITGKLDVRDFSRSLIEFALAIDQLDLDRYRSSPPPGSPQAQTPEAEKSFNETEIPIKALDALNVNGSVTFGMFKVSGLKLTDTTMKIAAATGKPKTDELTAKLYGGSITSRSEILPTNPPRIASKATVSNVQIGPLLKDMQGKDRVTGVGDLSFDIHSAGRTVGDVRKALGGMIDFNLANGAIKGVNIGLILRQAQALLRRQPFKALGQEAEQTDFADLKGRAKIVNGVLTTEYLTANSPAFRFAGEGSIDIGNERINYLLKPTVVETTEGSGGKGLEDLKGLTIPIRVTGTFDDPKWTPDLEEALKQQAGKLVNKELKKQEDKLKGKLGDFLKRSMEKQQQQQQPQQQQPPPQQPAPQQP